MNRDSAHLASTYRLDSIVRERWHTESYRPAWRYAPEQRCCDTIIIHDSVTEARVQGLATADTVTVFQHDTTYIPVEVPIEVAKPIPRFYRYCTVGFCVFVCFCVFVIFFKK